MEKIEIYDTTLRDGVQAEDVNFSVEDKIRIAHFLDEMEIDYIEGGYPGSNPKDEEFFSRIRKTKFRRAKLFSFGSTHKADHKPAADTNIQALLRTETPGAAIFGKSWKVHVLEALGISLERNVEIIHDSLAYLKSYFDSVFYDAEHFFDGYKDDPDYAIKTLKAAEEAGADCLVLCDTNGGTLPDDLAATIKAVHLAVSKPLAIHVHNDSDLAVANSLLAVSLGIGQVQGTINGLGERCGNANLCSVIANLMLKMGCDCIPRDKLRRLKELSGFVYELANLKPNNHQPFVGSSAFAHKGGIHVSAVTKQPQTYEHINPNDVGNHQRILVSEQAGLSNILYKAQEFNLPLERDNEKTREILKRLKELEHYGYQFEGAEASFEILMNKYLNKYQPFFELVGLRVVVEKRATDEEPYCEATIMVRVEGKQEHTAADGNGPVNAMDRAVRKALERFYPELKQIELTDYKVRVASNTGTGSKVRVLVESGDKNNKWGTVGVSENIIEASWLALVDSLEYKLIKTRR